MKILFVCHRLPYPPSRGGKIRPFNMIRWLGRQHEVTVASVARSSEELEEGRGLADFCHRYEVGQISAVRARWQAFRCLFTTRPASLGYFYVPRLHQEIRQLLRHETFDLILVHCSSAAQYVLEATNAYRIMDFGDMDSAKWFEYARHRSFPMSAVYWLEGVKLRRYEKQIARAFHECTVTAPGELKTLESYGLNVPVTLISNGVDLNFFDKSQPDYDPRALVFLGRMDYYPNIDGVTYFCRDILPRIRREVPDVQFTVVGSNPVRQIRRLAALPGVTVTGKVPDVRPYLQRAAVSVAPVRIARGVQNKVLESLAMRVPVVASTRAFEGIDAVAGEHLLVDDTPEGFARKVVSLLQDTEMRQRLAEAGRQRVETCHTWTVGLQQLDKRFAACAEPSIGFSR